MVNARLAGWSEGGRSGIASTDAGMGRGWGNEPGGCEDGQWRTDPGFTHRFSRRSRGPTGRSRSPGRARGGRDRSPRSGRGGARSGAGRARERGAEVCEEAPDGRAAVAPRRWPGAVAHEPFDAGAVVAFHTDGQFVTVDGNRGIVTVAAASMASGPARVGSASSGPSPRSGTGRARGEAPFAAGHRAARSLTAAP